jgi:hypothetical protein
MSSDAELEIAGTLIKAVIEILEEWLKNGGLSHDCSAPLSILERRYGPAKGTAYRKLPDPNPHERRTTDFGVGTNRHRTKPYRRRGSRNMRRLRAA